MLLRFKILLLTEIDYVIRPAHVCDNNKLKQSILQV